MQTLSVLHASFGLSLGMMVFPLACLTHSWPGSSAIDLYFHCLLFQVKSIRYQKHLSGINSPPVACNNPCHVVSDSCIFVRTCLARLLSSLTIKSVSYKGKTCQCSLCFWQCTNEKCNKHYFKNWCTHCSPNLGSCTISLACPGCQVTPLCLTLVALWVPKAVQMWCFKLASVWIILLTAECGAPSLHRLKAAIIRTIWL